MLDSRTIIKEAIKGACAWAVGFIIGSVINNAIIEYSTKKKAG